MDQHSKGGGVHVSAYRVSVHPALVLAVGLLAFMLAGWLVNEYAPDQLRFTLYLPMRVWCYLMVGTFYEDVSCGL